ncbi:hypothetical protein P280DRAFT_47788 [Massarina eburnea CBS 473.64]|uniref:Uncharacterized protein n=1 Tax=Massarina eburnea CBS 473.64 TaxID=1395130 RepID=A0A6A6RX86_9PLEO|nr:hypothetical protein P280DRAFT_47788 [Massarina eburnea CBS 473.64]
MTANPSSLSDLLLARWRGRSVPWSFGERCSMCWALAIDGPSLHQLRQHNTLPHLNHLQLIYFTMQKVNHNVGTTTVPIESIPFISPSSRAQASRHPTISYPRSLCIHAHRSSSTTLSLLNLLDCSCTIRTNCPSASIFLSCTYHNELKRLCQHFTSTGTANVSERGNAWLSAVTDEKGEQNTNRVGELPQ